MDIQKLKNEILREVAKWTNKNRYNSEKSPFGLPKGWKISKIVRNFFDDFLKTQKKCFDIYKLCSLLDLKIDKYADLNFNNSNSNVWGLLDKKNKKIYISKDIETERARRFTIAHELAHFLIDQNDVNDIFYRDRFKIGEEVIYNDFAASFLVDIEEVKNYINEVKQKNEQKFSLFKLSKKYDVPFETIGILIDLEEKIIEENSQYG